MKKIIGLVGANNKESTNRRLLQYMKNRYQGDNLDFELMEVAGLPLFNKPVDMQIPAQAQEMADKIEAADGVVISTPEYDHTIPASLINALNWLSYGVYPFVDKPVMITGASYGRLGSSRAQVHLRQVLDSPDIKARVVPNSEFLLGYSLDAFDEEGNLKDEATAKKLDEIFADYLTFIEISEQLTAARGSKLEEVQNFSWDQ